MNLFSPDDFSRDVTSQNAGKLAEFSDFLSLDIRAGTIIKAEPFPKAHKPSYRLLIDFGEAGRKKSSAQITELYSPEDLTGRQVLAVVNFPPRQIADFISEVLVLGLYTPEGVALIQPDRPVENGAKLG